MIMIIRIMNDSNDSNNSPKSKVFHVAKTFQVYDNAGGRVCLCSTADGSQGDVQGGTVKIR